MSNSNVYECVWPWRAGDKPMAAKAPMPPKAKALIQSIVMALIGLLVFRFMGHKTAGCIVWGLAGLVLISGLFIPPLFAAIERFGMLLGKWVGVGLTWGLLAPFYVVVFSAGHLFLFVFGKDLLCRRFPTQEPSYWTPRGPAVNLDRYGKQF